jgi:hypothetical protein
MTKAVELAQVASANVSEAFKNRLINGAFTISQYNGTSSVTPTSDAYVIDRWKLQVSQASKLSFQQNAGSVTPPVGFINYAGMTSLSAYSIGSSDYFNLLQIIEGFNCSDLGWGTANAKTITVSFQVYSSLTGTFGGALKNYDNSRSYPFSYSIPVANTWTTISFTVAGDTTGTWNTGNTGGILIQFGMGVGSTFSGTAGSWASANYISATGATSVVGTNGATFYITGVQLEVGSTASGYDYRMYDQELSACQRYLPAIITSTATGSPSFICNGYNASTGAWYGVYPFKVTPRTSPTGITTVNPTSSFNVFAYGSSYAISAIAYLGGTFDAGTFYATCTSLNVGQGSALSAINGNGQILFTGCEL